MMWSLLSGTWFTRGKLIEIMNKKVQSSDNTCSQTCCRNAAENMSFQIYFAKIVNLERFLFNRNLLRSNLSLNHRRHWNFNQLHHSSNSKRETEKLKYFKDME